MKIKFLRGVEIPNTDNPGAWTWAKGDVVDAGKIPADRLRVWLREMVGFRSEFKGFLKGKSYEKKDIPELILKEAMDGKIAFMLDRNCEVVEDDPPTAPVAIAPMPLPVVDAPEAIPDHVG